jgi:gliding motility-associated lipoprotein GldH
MQKETIKTENADQIIETIKTKTIKTKAIKMKNSLFVVILALLLGACQNNIVFEQTKDINQLQWHKDSIINLHFTPVANQAYDMFFLIRNDNDYPYSNLFIIAEIEDEKTKITDTLEYEMADEKGKWLGSGIWDLKESKLVYKTNYTFNNDLPKTFKIQQADRKSGQVNGDMSLSGIATVGIIIEKHIK